MILGYGIAYTARFANQKANTIWWNLMIKSIIKAINDCSKSLFILTQMGVGMCEAIHEQVVFFVIWFYLIQRNFCHIYRIRMGTLFE